jgi:poly(A) polymerase
MTLDRTAWDELLVSSDADSRLEDLQAQGVIREVFPALQALVGFGGGDTGHKCLWSHTKQVVIQTVPQARLRWASLFHDVGKPSSFKKSDDGEITFHRHEAASARIFKSTARKANLFTPDEIDEIAFIIYNLGRIEVDASEWPDSALRRLARDLGPHLEAVFAVARADCTTRHQDKRRAQIRSTAELKARVEQLLAEDAIPPALPKGLGHALMDRLGLPEGRELGVVMGKLKARVEAGELPRNATIEIYLAALEA